MPSPVERAPRPPAPRRVRRRKFLSRILSETRGPTDRRPLTQSHRKSRLLRSAPFGNDYELERGQGAECANKFGRKESRLRSCMPELNVGDRRYGSACGWRARIFLVGVSTFLRGPPVCSAPVEAIHSPRPRISGLFDAVFEASPFLQNRFTTGVDTKGRMLFKQPRWRATRPRRPRRASQLSKLSKFPTGSPERTSSSSKKPAVRRGSSWCPRFLNFAL